ncbi:hypothetical protein NQZ68_033308 [Dissostichus eleginoides]|nr:hypothetical protein NQZ68_033308 [Dissostichus eleginoides]
MSPPSSAETGILSEASKHVDFSLAQTKLAHGAGGVNELVCDSKDSGSSESAFLEDHVLGMGENLEIPCDLEDHSEPVVWFKDGAGLVPGNRTRLGQRLLLIINVSYEDSGVYSCRLAQSNTLLSNYTVRVTDSLSSGDDEDYDEDREDKEGSRPARRITVLPLLWHMEGDRGSLLVYPGRRAESRTPGHATLLLAAIPPALFALGPCRPSGAAGLQRAPV